MSIPLLHFPFVVQESIFKAMNYCEVFAMSLCSKRMKYCAIRAKRRVPKIWYCWEKDIRRISIQEKGSLPEDCIRIDCKNTGQNRGREVEFKIGDNCKPLLIKGKWQDTTYTYCTIRVPQIDAALTKALYEQVKSLYQYTEPCALEVYIESITEEVPQYENVNTIEVLGESSQLEDLETFLSQYPKVDTLWIRPSVHGELSSSSKILEIEKVHLTNSRQFGASLLPEFNGRTLDLFDSVFTEAELNLFIRKWMKNEVCHNLESAFISFARECVLNTNLVIDQLKTEAFDPAKQQEWHQFMYMSKNVISLPVDFSEYERHDVVREIDKKRATILANDEGFFEFLVWN